MGEFADDAFHAAVGRALMRWRLVEDAVFRAFVDVMAPIEPVSCDIVWQSHSGITARIKLLDELIRKQVADADTLVEWKAIRGALQDATKSRNHFAHSDISFLADATEHGSRYGLTDPRGRPDAPIMTKAKVESASREFQKLASRIDGLLSPVPRLRSWKTQPPS